MKKILLLLVLIGTLTSYAQDVPFDVKQLGDKPGFNKAVRAIKLGDIDYERGSEEDMANALKHYVVADSFNSKSAYLNFKMGVCHLYGGQKYEAKDRLEFVKQYGNSKDYPDLDFYLAQSYQLDGQWGKAIELFKAYKETLADADEEQRFFINKKIKECRVGEELASAPVRVWIDNLGPGVNSSYSDYGPVISADNRELFFTSRRPNGDDAEKDETGYNYEDIYSSSRAFGEEWDEAVNLGKPVNTKKHDATVGLAPDGRSLITYHGINRKNGNLQITKKDDAGNWEKLTDLGSNINSDYHEEAATLSFDEKKLFFVSDKPGGLGGHDIYVALWDEANQTWGEAENLGENINTEFDEKGVFFHPDGKTLYFSSAGHRTMGGLDIFKSEYNSDTEEWSTPVNIGYPINTPDDDVYFVVSGNERYAYYSSVREDGFGEKDIYKITFLGEKKKPAFAASDLVNGSLDTTYDERSAAGNFDKRDLIIVEGKVSDKISGAGLVSKITFIDAITNESISELVTEPDGTYHILLETNKDYAITAEKDGFTLASDNINPRFEDEGNSYTKNFGLSALDGTVVINNTNNTTDANDSNNATNNTDNANNNNNTDSASNNNSNSSSETKPNSNNESISFTLRNIYFDFDQSTLRHASVGELDKLVKILKENPEMRIQLVGHTDSRGPAWYNNALSKRRSKVAKDYLVSKGISASRIDAKGAGERELEVSDNQIENMSSVRKKEEAHQKNRRTVVKIID